MHKDGATKEWRILPQVWKEQICKGLDGHAVAKILAEHGMLVCGNDRESRYTKPVKIEGRAQRVYVVLPTILEGYGESADGDDGQEEGPASPAEDGNVIVLRGVDGKPQRPKK